MLGAEFIKAQLALRNKPSGPPVAVAATKSAEAEEARQNVHSAPYASSLLRCERTVDDACIHAQLECGGVERRVARTSSIGRANAPA